MAILAPMLAMAFLLLMEAMSVSHGQLQVGFYSDTCPDTEDIVSAAVHGVAWQGYVRRVGADPGECRARRRRHDGGHRSTSPPAAATASSPASVTPTSPTQ
uniref:Plant heme peroxidase family profile domain-containing protein n=1 Tax=Leersia perrieri TaxID=77586 RepID=A0A0D9XXM0_9ORYZ